MRRGLILVPVVALLLTPACGRDDDGAAAPTTTETVTETAAPSAVPAQTPTTTATETRAPTEQWSTNDVDRPFAGSVPPVPKLLAIRTGAHANGGFDRIAFEFDSLPGYRVGYRPEITYDGSGERVDLDGDAFVQVAFDPAQAHDDNGNPTLSSPPVDPVEVDYAGLEAYVLNGDFEGVVSVGLGLSGKVGFVVKQFQRANGNYVVYVDLARP